MTGFQVVDGDTRVIVMEGLSDGKALRNIIEKCDMKAYATFMNPISGPGHQTRVKSG